MATLVEGREYGLASNDLVDGNKTVVHFKLTDTSLKTLEELSRIKSARATIQFHGTEGVITIPGHGNYPERVFQISVSALPDVNASFDCIQQTSRHAGSSLVSLGTMQSRITVLATDDVFDRTKAKMSQVEEDNKKVCTKEIKPSGRHISRKVKKILAPGSLKIANLVKKSSTNSIHGGSFAGHRHDSLRSSPSPSGLHSPAHSLLTQGQNRTHSPTASTNQSTSTKTGNNQSTSTKTGNNQSTSTNTSVNQSASTNTGVNQSASTNTGVNQSTSKLSTNTSNPSRVLTSSAAKQFSGSINMPYRDRIIHLLALKPYKKPELVLRLQKDGIREKDKNSLGSVLQQVATLNKDNNYTLARGAWADVRQDWPFYTDQDRVLLKRNLQQESRTTVTSPAVSPASSNPESPGSSQKRTSEESEDLSNPNKKKRISHMRQDDEQAVSQLKPALSQQQSSPMADRENLDDSTDDVSDNKPDYIRTFVQIEDTDQRRLYKQEFNREYQEYRELHQQVDIVARRFQNLRTQINQTEEGSPDFEILKIEQMWPSPVVPQEKLYGSVDSLRMTAAFFEKIMALKMEVLEEYEAQKSDPKFSDRKQRMDYLHQKLGHIKRLIHEYDQRVQVVDGS